MRPEETAFFADLDGTLFDSTGHVSALNRSAIQSYIEAGGLFAISTGRDPRNIEPLLASVPVSGPCIVTNGAGAYDYAKKEWVFTKSLDKELLHPYFEEMLCRFPGMDFQIYSKEDGILYALPLSDALQGLLDTQRNCSRYVPFPEIDGTFLKVIVFVGEPRTEELHAYLLEGESRGWFRIMPGIVYSGGVRMEFFELLPVNTNKGTAIDTLRKMPLYKGRTFIAFGDYWNDEEMLRAADIPVCPANAEPELKALCPWVGPDNDHHLLKAFIEERMPLL